jgi:hypothetical protein
VVRSVDGHTSAAYGPTMAKPPSANRFVAINSSQKTDIPPMNASCPRAARTSTIAAPKPKIPPDTRRPIVSDRKEKMMRPTKPARLTKIMRNAARSGRTPSS